MAILNRDKQLQTLLVDGELVEVTAKNNLSEIVNEGVESINTYNGKTVVKDDFAKTSIPPEGFSTNLSHIDKG